VFSSYSDQLCIALGAAAVAPASIQVSPAGWVKTTKGDYLCDGEAMDLVMQSFREQGVDVVIDYEHQTQGRGPAPAAGWINKLTARPDGLWATVEWTPRATEYLQRREYRYLSPVIMVRKSDKRVVQLRSAALTNEPATMGQRPLVLKADGGLYQPPFTETGAPVLDELQLKINEMMGVDAETFKKYGPKGENERQPGEFELMEAERQVRRLMGLGSS